MLRHVAVSLQAIRLRDRCITHEILAKRLFN
jgi:hypothetical protein